MRTIVQAHHRNFIPATYQKLLSVIPSEKDATTDTLEKRLWAAADQFRANSGLKPQEYSGPILGLIFLRFAEVRFAGQRKKLEQGAAHEPLSRRAHRTVAGPPRILR
jgi:type I restriction enzyme M protein